MEGRENCESQIARSYHGKYICFQNISWISVNLSRLALSPHFSFIVYLHLSVNYLKTDQEYVSNKVYANFYSDFERWLVAIFA